MPGRPTAIPGRPDGGPDAGGPDAGGPEAGAVQPCAGLIGGPDARHGSAHLRPVYGAACWNCAGWGWAERGSAARRAGAAAPAAGRAAAARAAAAGGSPGGQLLVRAGRALRGRLLGRLLILAGGACGGGCWYPCCGRCWLGTTGIDPVCSSGGSPGFIDGMLKPGDTGVADTGCADTSPLGSCDLRRPRRRARPTTARRRPGRHRTERPRRTGRRRPGGGTRRRPGHVCAPGRRREVQRALRDDQLGLLDRGRRQPERPVQQRRGERDRGTTRRPGTPPARGCPATPRSSPRLGA